jgi:hypothetical protein
MGPQAGRILIVGLLAVALTACRGGQTNRTVGPTVAPTTTTPGTARAVVTATAHPRPHPASPDATPPTIADCDRAIVGDVVRAFIEAFNRGDQEGLARVFPAHGTDDGHPWNGDPSQLRWFTLVRAAPSKGVDALNLYNREALLSYFAERHAQGERMRLLELVVNPAAGITNGPAINFRITRTAADLPEQTFFGKGGVNCVQRTIFLWSQGAPFDGAASPTP